MANWKFDESELGALFEQCGLIYIPNDQIPAELQEAGWLVHVYHKEASDGVIVLQMIFGPKDGKKSVCRRVDAVIVAPDKQVEVVHEKCLHTDPCNDLFLALKSPDLKMH